MIDETCNLKMETWRKTYDNGKELDKFFHDISDVNINLSFFFQRVEEHKYNKLDILETLTSHILLVTQTWHKIDINLPQEEWFY